MCYFQMAMNNSKHLSGYNLPGYNIVNNAYENTIRYMPQWMQNHPKTSATIFGTTGTFAAVKVLQLTSSHLIDKIIPGFHEIALPFFEGITAAGFMVYPARSYFYDSWEFKTKIEEHPVYTSGMTAAGLTGIALVVMDLYQRGLF